MNVPVPVPSDVMLSEVVGSWLVDQHTPLAVTEAPPSEEMPPPLSALFDVIDDTGAVVNVGTVASVVNVCSSP